MKHPKFARLSHLLTEPKAHVRGYLELMWEVGYECGDEELGDEVDVELACGWTGEPGKLFKALLSCGGTNRAGFIEPIPEKDGCYRIHDLYDHAPDYVRRRMDREVERRRAGTTISDLRRAASLKRKGIKTSVNDSQLLTLATCESANGATPAPAPAPAPAPEEETPPESCSEPSLATASEPAVLVFPTVGTGAKTWNLVASKIAEYRETYPGVDVEAECRKALQWCRDYPERRKTARGMPRFLNGWLSRSQDSGGTRNGRPRTAYQRTIANGPGQRHPDDTAARSEIGKF